MAPPYAGCNVSSGLITPFTHSMDKPQRLIETTFQCIDAGCWYITLFRNGTVAAMDLDDAGKVTRAINGGENGLDDRTKFTNRIRKVLL